MLAPLQLATAVGGGVEGIVHAVQAAMLRWPDYVVFFSLDIVNAINALDQTTALGELLEHPELAATLVPFVRLLYDEPGELRAL